MCTRKPNSGLFIMLKNMDGLWNTCSKSFICKGVSNVTDLTFRILIKYTEYINEERGY